mmetsp:Transcript_4566/g.7909  ORF Transcript_4566/g.7909 Transcript_4566/m.7909 type:complete len:399 (+) Transcript_4566:90-1286(+)
MAAGSGADAGAATNAAGDASAEPPGDEGATYDGNGGDDYDGDDLVGEGDGDDDDDGVTWEELFACPLTVRFTQDKIHPFFYRRGPIVNVIPKIRIVPYLRAGLPGVAEPVGISSMDVARGNLLELVPPFGPIHCLRKGKHLWSMDNRRLYALQLAATNWWPQRCCVRLLCSDRLPRRKFKTQYRKFKTESEGRVVHICARYQKFDVWSWFENAVEQEWYTLSQRLGVLLSVFETLPVIGALLFRTGITGLKSRAPLIGAFLLTFALDFIRQKVPACERKICELHVKAVMDGEIKICWPCRRREALFSGNGYDIGTVMSAPLLAAMMTLVLTLMLPYVIAIPFDKLRSSVFSCWLGIACVLLVQLLGVLRSHLFRGRDAADDEEEFTGSAQQLSPKHRD